MRKSTRILTIVTLSLGLLWTVTHAADSTSHVKVEFVGPKTVDPVKAVEKYLPMNDPSITVEEVRNTGLVNISIVDADPKKAADRANALARMVQTNMAKAQAGEWIKIWELAVPEERAARR
jgi:capsular polysaccharide biosynthesis protein